MFAKLPQGMNQKNYSERWDRIIENANHNLELLL